MSFGVGQWVLVIGLGLAFFYSPKLTKKFTSLVSNVIKEGKEGIKEIKTNINDKEKDNN